MRQIPLHSRRYYSPTVSGYALKNSSDSYVTYAMMDKSFPASHYVRNGTATYTVYYVKTASSTITYQYEDRSGTAAPTKTVTGKQGASFTVTSPTVTGYTPNRSSVSGTYGDGNHSVYYYENPTPFPTMQWRRGAPSSQTSGTPNLKLSSTKPTARVIRYKVGALQAVLQAHRIAQAEHLAPMRTQLCMQFGQE